eukprot:SAG11_NODE_2386_length_3418_cov_1.215728_6_plen_93_part_00
MGSSSLQRSMLVCPFRSSSLVFGMPRDTCQHVWRCSTDKCCDRSAEAEKCSNDVVQIVRMVSQLLQRHDMCRAPLVRLSLVDIIADLIRMDR